MFFFSIFDYAHFYSLKFKTCNGFAYYFFDLLGDSLLVV